MNIKNCLAMSAIAAVLLSTVSTSHATVLPFGPQNDVTLTQVSDWGFSTCSVVNASTSDESSRPVAMLSGCTGDYLMMAMRRVGSTTYDVLAAANYGDVLFESGTGDVTHLANGSEWYFNDNFSWGFAGAGDVVQRDTAISSLVGMNNDRLSWHTADNLSAGYRSGANLAVDSGWEKCYWLPDAVIAVPGRISRLGRPWHWQA
ncbi:MAG: hypothetical protein IPF55_11740 [Rhodoferax sp.]|nr:hypothetical protein [Rhodoferax sp.]